MLLTSIWINSSGEANAASLPPPILENIHSLQKNHPHIPHKLFGTTELLSFLEEKFSREVLSAFLALKPYAYKADLARYCVLHEYGGVYADLSYYFVRPLPMDSRRVVVFRDFMWSSPWDVSNGVFFAPPKHKALEIAIQMVCANVRRGYYGNTPLCPTGPALFGKALATVCEPQDIVTGVAGLVSKEMVAGAARNIELPPDEKSHCLILRNELLALKRKRMGSPGLSDFGVADVSGYSDLWRQRAIYSSGVVASESFHGEAEAADGEEEAGMHASLPWSVAEWFETSPGAPPGFLRRLMKRLQR